MLQLLNKRRGQSTLEYAVLTAVIIGALVSVQTYIKRGVQGRLKSASDDIGDQFSPGNTNEIKTVKTVSNTVETFNAGVANTSMNAPEQTNTTVNSIIANVDQEYWVSSQAAVPAS